jgi:SIR2-like domain
MSLKYFEDGPTFPNELLDQLVAGEVVFLCGAGVSFPQLPGFKDLVEKTFDRLGLEMDVGEQAAFDGNRYEEVLGSLARRLVHPSKMYEAVESLLAPPENPDLSRHNTLLRLSMNLDNRHCLVTTNFDPLFERAVVAQKGAPVVQQISVAGQALPAPGAEDFHGIIHLHGRHEDVPTEIKGTPLVLTSAEYGDAYMRSGWASRFLFDLARCKTIVLVGYSAGDAPVRYFLNILEADRERFPDLRTVYTFDGVDDAADEADARWSTVAVHPITYQKATEGLPSHGTLWRDLERLADLIERPKPNRRRMAEEILSKSYSAASAIELNQIVWLQKGRGDLWDIIITKIQDPAWFDYFSRQELWQPTDPTWVLPKWFAHRWTELKALRSAALWCNKSGVELIENLEREIRHRPPPPGLWFRAWQLLVSCNLQRMSLRRENGYQLAGHIRNGRLI